MQPFQAIVKNGRLTLDEPTDLPDGHVVVLLALEDLLASAEAFGEERQGNGVGGGGGLSFEIIGPSSQRQFRKTKAVDASALLEELRSL